MNRTTYFLLTSSSLANLDIRLLEMGSEESVIGCCGSLRSSCPYYGGEDSDQKVTRDSIQWLLKYGITHVISLESDANNRFHPANHFGSQKVEKYALDGKGNSIVGDWEADKRWDGRLIPKIFQDQVAPSWKPQSFRCCRLCMSARQAFSFRGIPCL